MFRDRFWLSLTLTIPVIFYSETIQGWFGYTAPSFPGSEWISPVPGHGDLHLRRGTSPMS
ncbi:MAG TPA: hypothetical protein VFZ80_00010 [Acidimicrobiia bacterium]